MKLPYFPGCTLKTTAANFESSAIASAQKIGIEFLELDRWNCCGVVSSLTSDDLMKHLAPVRNFLRVQEMNAKKIVEAENQLVTLCSMCYNTLSLSNLRMKENPDDLQKVNDFMHKEEEDYLADVDVVHFLPVLKEFGFEKITEKLEKPLANLKVAAYYGCTLLRPKSVAIDDTEDPTMLEELTTSLGAVPVDWNAKSRCCGSYHTVNNVDIVYRLIKGIIQDAQESEADVIITSCPLCAFNLDSRQQELKEKNPDFKTIPILYFTQLMGVALGIDKEELGLNQNKIDPAKIIEDIDKRNTYPENKEELA